MFYKKQLIRNTSEIANQNKKQTLYISRKVRNMALVKILVLRNKKFERRFRDDYNQKFAFMSFG